MKCTCGKEFQEVSPNNKYCSGKCRVRESVKRYRSKLASPISSPRIIINKKKELPITIQSMNNHYLEYGCGCPKEDKEPMCTKHGRV